LAAWWPPPTAEAIAIDAAPRRRGANEEPDHGGGKIGSTSTKMKSGPRGRNTSEVEVGNVSAHGFWLLVGDQEKCLSFKNFPWIRDATIGQLTNVELPSSHHLYWLELDIDLAVESLDHPDGYPLVSRVRPDVRHLTSARVRERQAVHKPRRGRRR
jgi:hypothetical protein